MRVSLKADLQLRHNFGKGTLLIIKQGRFVILVCDTSSGYILFATHTGIFRHWWTGSNFRTRITCRNGQPRWLSWMHVQLVIRRLRVYPTHSFMEIDQEIFSTVILSLQLIQEEQLSVSGKRMCTILVNHLQD